MKRPGQRARRAAHAPPDGKVLAGLVAKRARATPDLTSLSEMAYRQLRRAIHGGTIATNVHLTETDLAAWLKMSRTPVREAMRRLQSEGLLVNQPFRGAVVVGLDENHLRDLYAVRELLEVAAVVWCATHANDRDIAALEDILAKESASLRDAWTLIDLNQRFHQTICHGAHNEFLLRALSAIQSSFVLLGKSNLVSEERARESHAEHLAILKAIRSHDPKAAERAAKAHVRTSLRQRLKQYAGSRRREASPELT
jgi:DNA-binding GntR family transcriptional regulator